MAKREKKYARNRADHDKMIKEKRKGLTKEQRAAAVKEAREGAKKRRARIRDVGQAVPEGYIRKTGSLYFSRKENERLLKRNGEDVNAWASANRERFMKKGGWMDSVSRNGMFHRDGGMNLRKTTVARNAMKKYGLHAQLRDPGDSKFTIYWGQDGKQP